jgi:hypothetical protein
LLQASGANITWDGQRAIYRLDTETIHMPARERFSKPVNAYAVALHELTHWSGHASRLGLKGARLENHANYVQSWLRVLRNDKSPIFTASRSASAAYQFILQKAGVAEMADAVEVVEALSACEGMRSKGRAGPSVFSTLSDFRAGLGAAAPPRGIPREAGGIRAHGSTVTPPLTAPRVNVGQHRQGSPTEALI